MRFRILAKPALAGMVVGLSVLIAANPAHAAKSKPMVQAAPARGLPDTMLSPLSLRMLQTGETHLAAGRLREAEDSFESALVADPRNRRAYIGLARAAEAEGMPGKAVRLYREALELDPNDLAALELQGMVLVERGAKARAEANLERVRKLCTQACPEADRLAAAIERGPTAKAKAVTAEVATKTATEATASLDKDNN